jgi:hypothetical protein
MKLRTIVITVAVLAALSIAAYLRNRPQVAPPADHRVGTVLLDDATATKAAAIVVSDQGKKVELAKGTDGSWTVRSYYGLPADFDKVSRLVQDLNESKVDRFVTESPARLERLEFKDSGISLRDASGKEIWSVTFGKTPDSGNGKFIRFGSEPKAFFSSTRVWLDTDAKGWANSSLATAKADDVSKITVPVEDGRTVTLLRKTKDAAWTTPEVPKGKVLSADKAASILGSLTSLRFSDTTDPKDSGAAEASKYARTFTLTTFSGETVAITLARKPEEKKLKPPVADAKPSVDLSKDGTKKEDAKPMTPEFETIPAGPVYISISHSGAAASEDALMKLRSFQTDEYTYTGLPQKADDLFSDAPAK